MKLYTLLLTVPALLSSASTASQQSHLRDTAEHTVVNSLGSAVVPGQGPYTAASPSAPSTSLLQSTYSVLWTYSHLTSIPNSVCLADTADETWAGQNLNVERLQLFQTAGNGVPLYEYNLASNPSAVGVASAENASLGVVVEQNPAGVVVRGFNGASNTPLWTYSFAANITTAPIRAVDVNDDGSLVLVGGWDSTTPEMQVVLLDGATGIELRRYTSTTFSLAVELSASGGRAVVTEGPAAVVLDTSTMASIFSFSVSGSGGHNRISADGRTVAAGGFNLRVFSEASGTWTQIYSEQEPTQWYGQGLALDAGGATLMATSHTYTNYLTLTYRVVDLTTATELGRHIESGGGSYQDAVARAQASADGEVFAVASWGTQLNDHAEVLLIDRSANVIGGIDTPGSAFDVDLSADGRFVVVGAKEVHANISANGGDVVVAERDSVGTVFCTSKTGLVCGVPVISASGISSVGATSGFTISAGPARSNKSGILLYNVALGANPVPFQGGTLCVEPMGLRRAGSTNSMGTCPPGSNCLGQFDIDMNAFSQAAWVVSDCAGAPTATAPNNPAMFLSVAGTTVHCQYWGRDSVATGSFVSDGLSYVVGP